MVSLYRDPTGENVLSHNLPSSYPTNTTNESSEETISGLRARIKELESILSSKEVSIQKVITIYHKLRAVYLYIYKCCVLYYNDLIISNI